MAAGILEYKRFINIFTTADDVRNTFPRDQYKYTYDFGGAGADGWTSTASWMTLIIDSAKFDSNNEPDFTNSIVTGYFLGGGANQGSSGTMSFPANMYTGPILPGFERNIPVTAILITWTKGAQQFQKQLLLIQNWEPGVTPGDPTLDDNYIPIENLTTSTLTLYLDSGPVVFGEEFQLTAETTMPSELSNTAAAKFYIRGVSTSTFLGSATFVNQYSRISIPTDYGDGNPRNINSGTYSIYATAPSRREYSASVSNTVTQVIYEGIPLNVALTLTPGSVSNFNTSVNIQARATTASGYTPIGVAIQNTVTFRVIGTSTFVQQPTTVISTTTFNNGFAQANVNITRNFIDTTITRLTNYNVLSITGTTASYTATVEIIRNYPIQASWNFYRPGRYASGSTTTNLAISTVTSFTYPYRPITVQATEDYGVGSTFSLTSATHQTYNNTGPLLKLKASMANTSTSDFVGFTATVTFKALFTTTMLTDDIDLPDYDLNATPHYLIAAIDSTNLRFDSLPFELAINDTFVINNVTFTVRAINFDDSIVTTDYWPGKFNPTQYFNSPIEFIKGPDSVPLVYQWLSTGYTPNIADGGFWPYPTITLTSANNITNGVYQFNKLPENLKLYDTFTFVSPSSSGCTDKIGETRTIYGIDFSTNRVVSFRDWDDRVALDWQDWRGSKAAGMIGAYVTFSSAPYTATNYTSVILGTQTNATITGSSVDWILSTATLSTGTYLISADISYSNNWPIYYRPSNSTQTWKLIVSEPLVADLPGRLVVTSTTNVLSVYDYGAVDFLQPVSYFEGVRSLGQAGWTQFPDYQISTLSLNSGTIVTATLVNCYWPGTLNDYRANDQEPKYRSKTFDLTPLYESRIKFVSTNTQYSYNSSIPIEVLVSGSSNDYLNDPVPTGLVEYRNTQSQLIVQDTLESGLSSVNIAASTLTNVSDYFSSGTIIATYLGDTIRTASTATKEINIYPNYSRILSRTDPNYISYRNDYYMNFNIPENNVYLGPWAVDNSVDLTNTSTFKFGFAPGTTGIGSLTSSSFVLKIKRYTYTNSNGGQLLEENLGGYFTTRLNDVNYQKPYNNWQTIGLTNFDSTNKVWTYTLKHQVFSYFSGNYNSKFTFSFERATGQTFTLPNNIVLWKSSEVSSGYRQDRKPITSTLTWNVYPWV